MSHPYPKLPFIQIQFGYCIAIGIWANGETRVRELDQEIIVEEAIE